VVELVRPALAAVTLNSFSDIAVDARQFSLVQAACVEAPQVVGVSLPLVDVAIMLREELQERSVPRERSVVAVKRAVPNVEAIKRDPDGT
jgi:hypothetical protein